MNKLVREAVQVFEKAGVEVEEVGNRNNGHKFARIVNRDGATMKYTLSISPSDTRRYLKNLRADARCFAKTGKIRRYT